MEGRCDRRFEALLRRAFDVAELDRHPATVLALWPDFRIAYINPAWDTFAEQNGGRQIIRRWWDLGSNYLDGISPPLRPFYQHLLETSPEGTETLHPITHDYECSSARLHRIFTLQVYTLPARAGYVLVNSRRVEESHAGPEVIPTELNEYVGTDGFSHQCSNCRRIENLARPGAWDWVPQWVAEMPPHASHSICPTCFVYYYGYPDAPADPWSTPE